MIRWCYADLETTESFPKALDFTASKVFPTSCGAAERERVGIPVMSALFELSAPAPTRLASNFHRVQIVPTFTVFSRLWKVGLAAVGFFNVGLKKPPPMGEPVTRFQMFRDTHCSRNVFKRASASRNFLRIYQVFCYTKHPEVSLPLISLTKLKRNWIIYIRVSN